MRKFPLLDVSCAEDVEHAMNKGNNFFNEGKMFSIFPLRFINCESIFQHPCKALSLETRDLWWKMRGNFFEFDNNVLI